MKTTPYKQIFLVGHDGPKFELVSRAVNEAARAAADLLGVEIEIARTHQQQAGSSIHDSIRDLLRSADLIVADLSETSPNVMWEVGFANALAKPIFLLSDDVGLVPFNLQSNKVFLYQPSAPISSITTRLTEGLAEALSAPEEKAPVREAESIPRRQRIFISYSHEDRPFLHRILVHLRPLEMDGRLDLWSDSKINAGDRWREEIRNALSTARIAVLVISADFLASDFVVTNELPPLLSAAEEKGARIIPVIAKPSRFLRDEKLARFQALNDPGEPLIQLTEADREAIYAKLAETIEVELATVLPGKTSNQL